MTHRCQRRWYGYAEPVGIRQRYRLIDREAKLRWQGGGKWQELAQDHRTVVDRAVAEGQLSRNPMWTESITTGGPGFTKQVMEKIKNRVRLSSEEPEPGVWTVWAPEEPYGLSSSLQEAKNE